MTPIFIPTLETETLATFINLPISLQKRSVVVRPGHKRYRQGEGAHIVRQSILDDCRLRGIETAIILVDTLKFQHGVWEEGKKRFRSASSKQIESAFSMLEEKSKEDGVGFTTFSTPFFNNQKDVWIANRRVAYSFFVNVQSTTNCRFDGGPSRMSDIKFSFECYTSGLRSYSLMSDSVVDVAKSPTVQIESVQRANRFEEAIDYLVGRWPEFIKERDASQNKRHIQLVGTSRDVTVFPSKAFKSFNKKSAERIGG